MSPPRTPPLPATTRSLPDRGTVVQVPRRSGILQVADRPDLRPLRAVEPHRLAPQAAGSAIELAPSRGAVPTARAPFAPYEGVRRAARRRPRQARAGQA